MRYLTALIGLLFLAGCSTIVSSISQDFTDALGAAILDNDDLQLVEDGAPSYLILVDALLERQPDNAQLLLQAAELNSAYGSAFVDDPERAVVIQSKALDLALRAACVEDDNACQLRSMPFERFEQWLAERNEDDVPLLYGLGSTWAGWIQVNSGDFNAIAELSRVQALMTRVVVLDEAYQFGNAHTYLGVLGTLVPPALGGRPEEARQHFERALELSEGRNLMTKVFYAEQYARLVFDRELHDRLLNEVVDAEPDSPGLTLVNGVAKQRAVELLEDADDYF